MPSPANPLSRTPAPRAPRNRRFGASTMVMRGLDPVAFQETTLVMRRPPSDPPPPQPASAASPASPARPAWGEMTRVAPVSVPSGMTPGMIPGPMVPPLLAAMPPMLAYVPAPMPGSAATGNDGAAPAPTPTPTSTRLSPVVAFVLSLVAVAVALVFDLLFLRVHLPVIGGYAWYLTTALSFGAAGFGGAKWTRAKGPTAMTAVVFAAVVYGLGDLALGRVIEELSMSSALFLAVQGIVIAFACGAAGAKKGLVAAG